MEEQQNTLKMKIDQKTVFILITVLSFFLYFSFHLFIKNYKCLQHNNESIQLAVIEIFTPQKTDKHGFTFSIGFTHLISRLFQTALFCCTKQK